MTRETQPNRSVRTRRRRHLAFDQNESRLLLATFSVINTNDSGPGSLRQAILDANTQFALNPPGTQDVIDFSIDPSVVQHIQPLSALPTINDSVLIDGTSEQFTNPNTGLNSPGIAIEGLNLFGAENGFVLNKPNITIQGLIINQFPQSGIVINVAATNAVIQANYIGTNPTGTLALGNLGDGITVNASGALIGGDNGNGLLGNVISASGNNGITVATQAKNTQIQGNFVGTDVTGNFAIGNALFGVLINSTNNTIGGSLFTQGNVLSANQADGLGLFGSSNEVYNNLIGISVSATGGGIDSPSSAFTVLANAGNGIQIGTGAKQNFIGVPGQGNLIAGNARHGILLRGASDANLIQGNGIGATLATGSSVGSGIRSLGNDQDGIHSDFSSQNTIGGVNPGEGNLISGNAGSGINLANNDTNISGNSGNLVQGNIIGLDLSGNVSIPNSAGGIFLTVSSKNTIGGSISGAANIISSNRGAGLTINGNNGLGSGNLIQANIIGVSPNGQLARGNTSDGIDILNSKDNLILSNLISANSGHGVSISGTSANNNIVSGNTIGLSASGTILANLGDGIRLRATGNSIGGIAASQRNIISGNQGNGINVLADTNLIQGNFIGTNSAGLSNSLGNQLDGILIHDARGITIGGSVAGSGNVITGNKQNGIHVDGISSLNTILGNIVGLNLDGTQPQSSNLINGILLEGAKSITVGSTTPLEANVISGNGGNGLVIQGGDSDTIRGNFIGTDPTGKFARGNALNGIIITNSLQNTIGGINDGSTNVVSANGLNGIVISGAAQANQGHVLQRNMIGTDISGTKPLGNGIDGLLLDNTSFNEIGGPPIVVINNSSQGGINTISANGGHGIEIRGAGSQSNQIIGNAIGTTTSGQQPLGNQKDGVSINGGSNNLIGRLNPQQFPNFIAGNAGNGISIFNGSNNVIAGNIVGTDADGVSALANGQNGIFLGSNATGNSIGLGLVGLVQTRNIISGNLANGIQIAAGASKNSILGNRIGTDRAGISEVHNGGSGIAINDSGGNTIGSTSASAGNLISGNLSSGISLNGELATQNVIQANLLGTEVSGTFPLGNRSAGISLENAPMNTIGGANAGEGNTIAGNRSFGILISDAFSTGNLVQKNFIGTNKNGGPGLGNDLDGILISDAPATSAAAGNVLNANVVSGNKGNGIHVSATAGGTFVDNLVGVDPTGTQALGNRFDGILIDGSRLINISSTFQSGVISGNGRNGIEISGNSSKILITGNLIGTDKSGQTAIANGTDGILASNSSQIHIGTAANNGGNLISGNSKSGIHFVSVVASQIVTNRIGTNGGSSSGLGNLVDGIRVESGSGNVIGGTSTSEGNLISGNKESGVHLLSATTGNAIAKNTIGTDIAGNTAIANTNFGVAIEASSNNLIYANLASANGLAGIYVVGQTSLNNSITSNILGTNRQGTSSLSNGYGIFIDGSSGNTIGGTGAFDGNLISGNVIAGVHIFNRFASRNLVQGNRIGTDASGLHTLIIPGSTPMQQVGVLINSAPGLDQQDNPAPGNTVGGTTAAARNLISGNLVGVQIYGPDGTVNVIQGNWIGPDANGGSGASNQFGVFLSIAPGNTIGGTTPGAGNVISNNTVTGIYLLGAYTRDNQIQGNFIGTTPDGQRPLGNKTGVYVENAPNNLIGGPGTARNVISANDVAGVYILGPGSTNNQVLNNDIGLAAAGSPVLGNKQYGVLLYNAPNNNVPRTPGAKLANRIQGSGIANFREFTGKPVSGNPNGSVGTPQKPAVLVGKATPAGVRRFNKSSRVHA